MASPLGDRVDSKPPDPVYGLVLSKFQGDLAERLNVQQMFILIDGVLPFEACLYYQVLPLFIEGSRLNLGMVSPQDTSAADYVRRIVAYHHYSLIPRQISSEALQGALSAYLNYSGKQQATAIRQPPPSSKKTSRPAPKARSEASSDPNQQGTLIVDSPTELGTSERDFRKPSDSRNAAPHPPFTDEPVDQETFPTLELRKERHTSIPSEPAVEEHPVAESFSPAVELKLPPEPSLPPEPTLPVDDIDPFSPPAPEVKPATLEAPPLVNRLPELDIHPNYLSSPIDAIATLPPQELLRELLGRALHDGIGRLYFERQPHQGRVLWSQSGVLQSIINHVDLTVFQIILNELKKIAGLTLISIQKAKQVEIERIYQQTRVLLRFKFMPTEHGEEATIQVLRGAALKFYQQQQLANLERDALTIAKQLQTKISEIRDRARVEPSLAGAKLDALPALSQLLKHIEEQLDTLQQDGSAEIPEED
jgi:hypothetical protein